MLVTGEVDIRSLMEGQPKMSRFSLAVLLLLCALMFLEGYDMGALGYVAPAVIRAWHLSKGQFVPVVGFAMVGITIGGALVSNLGDRFGRKRLLGYGSLAFGAFTLLCGMATSLQMLLVMRFFGTIFLGAVVPNAVAMAAESASPRKRARYVSLTYLGYTAGSALGGFIAGGLIPHHGWRVVFYIGGIVPILTAILIAAKLPESVRFLSLIGRQAEVRSIMSKIRPDLTFSPEVKFLVVEEKRAGIPFKHLFTQGRTSLTLLIWVSFIGSFMTLNFITSWLPTVLNSAGVPMSRALVAVGLFHAGGSIGCLFAGQLIDKFGPRMVAFWALLAAPFIFMFGTVASKSQGTLMTLMLLGGLCVVNSQAGLVCLCGIFYPTFIRSTGTGWAHGVGRVGSIVGPVVGGILVAMGLPLSTLFLVLAIPPLVVSVAVFALTILHRDAGKHDEAGTFVPAAAMASSAAAAGQH